MMVLVAEIVADPSAWVLLGLAALAFGWNAYNRAYWDVSWDTPPRSRPALPERCWSYDAAAIENFARAAMSLKVRGHRALVFYVKRILRGSDIAFAVALAVLTAYVWYRVAMAPWAWPVINWIALPAAAMSILYGIADVAEDMKLASILSYPDKVDHAEAAALNMLTRIKLTALTLSVVGIVLFGIYALGEWILTRVLQRMKSDARPGHAPPG